MAKIKSHWEKTTPFGNYRLTEDRVNSRNKRNSQIISKARALGLIGKHAGSKPISRLLDGIAKVHEDKRKFQKEENN